MNTIFTFTKNKKNQKTFQKVSFGFTLVEVLIAITIFTIAITGVITVAARGGLNINSSKNRLTANYLAQEGIELVRAKRDSYVLSDSTSYADGWNAFALSLTGSCTGPCGIDSNSMYNLGPTGPGFISCASSGLGTSPCALFYNSDGFYVHGGVGTPTPFTRQLTIAPYFTGTSTTELEITSTVTWNEGSVTKAISMNESLFNWYTTH